ncbi:MAG: galactose-1-phosphate uridylyltransferase [Thermoguttaceae bacterium]|jgi:UDPglucose--hexose-1-phosphate uridylyltransferase|nr:galactose-1-phosphate uridylyltransferase [Thermoguttaceae bacterium]
MPDLRKDPIVGRWVIIAENRANRPQDYTAAFQAQRKRPCPFCEGNEHLTPDEITACRASGTQRNREGWRIRVVGNKYPALVLEGDPHQHQDGLYKAMDGVGAHEVIVESPRHIVTTSELAEKELREVLAVYRDRLDALRQDGRLAYGLIFKNVGAAAGASLEHLHSQLIATPVVPVSVQEEIAGSLAFYRDRGNCVYCEMLGQELASPCRVVLKTPRFVAFEPFASRFPFETWVVPARHASHYEDIGNAEIEELAGVMKQVLGKIETVLEPPAYNYVVHTAPFDVQHLAHYHWHIEIMPRVTGVAGFEWGAGFHINPVAPEQAAALLREVAPDRHQSKTFLTRETG